eukprot:6197933-Pleurochrysis_carterae.AAC.1
MTILRACTLSDRTVNLSDGSRCWPARARYLHRHTSSRGLADESRAQMHRTKERKWHSRTLQEAVEHRRTTAEPQHNHSTTTAQPQHNHGRAWKQIAAEPDVE